MSRTLEATRFRSVRGEFLRTVWFGEQIFFINQQNYTKTYLLQKTDIHTYFFLLSRKLSFLLFFFDTICWKTQQYIL